MTLKQIQWSWLSLALIAIASLFSSLLWTNDSAYALCPQNAGRNDQCFWDNYNNITDKRDVSRSEYDQMVTDCTGGFFNTNDEGSCSNAVSGCISQAIDYSACTNDKIKELAGCSEGDVSKCQGKLNMSEYNDAQQQAKDQIMNTCTVNAGNDVADRQACERAYDSARNACNSLSSGYTRSQYDAYQSCLAKNVASSSRDSQECSARGGVWSSNKCIAKNQPYSDYTDKASCDAAGGTFTMTQKGANGAADTWTCMSPKKYIEDAKNQQECAARGGNWGVTSVAQNSASAGSGSCTAPAGTVDDPNPNDPNNSNSPVDPVQGQSPSTGGQNCGKARTNIIKCQGEGAQAFGDLLKQLLSLLTMGVGILAVGGILFGAIMYASAQDNAGQVQKAISIITNTVIGLLLYIFMFAIANWLVPGGVIQ